MLRPRGGLLPESVVCEHGMGWKTGEETLVWAKSGFKSNERMMDFPWRVRAWESSAFHPPPVCYKGPGYLVEGDRDTVRISPGQAGDVHVGGVVPMKKLWPSRVTDGEVWLTKIIRARLLGH